MDDKSWIQNLLSSRDELSLRGVRLRLWASIALFPLAIILSDLLYRQQQTSIFGIDSVLIQSSLYGLAWLITALLPIKALPIALRIGAWGGGLLAVPTVLFFANGWPGLILLAAFQFFIGLAAATGFRNFCFVSNNAERWLAVLVIGIYFGLSWMLSGMPLIAAFIRNVLPVILACFLVFATFFVKDNTAETSLPQQVRQTQQAQQPPSSFSGDKPGIKGYYSVLAIAVIYYLISLTNSYLESGQGFLNYQIYGLGMLLGALTAVVLQLLLNRSVWHLWNIYLLLVAIGMLAAAFDTGMDALPGSLLYGFADNLGYLAMLYLMGSVAKMDGRHSFYRWLCLFAFLFGCVVPASLNLLFTWQFASLRILAVIIVVAAIGVYVLLSPVLYRNIFASDWADSLNALDTKAYVQEIANVQKIDLTEGLGLTERERQVFTLLMTDMARKQIAFELKISNPTANFHINNLYRKLNVQSRAELFAKYG